MWCDAVLDVRFCCLSHACLRHCCLTTNAAFHLRVSEPALMLEGLALAKFAATATPAAPCVVCMACGQATSSFLLRVANTHLIQVVCSVALCKHMHQTLYKAAATPYCCCCVCFVCSSIFGMHQALHACCAPHMFWYPFSLLLENRVSNISWFKYRLSNRLANAANYAYTQACRHCFLCCSLRNISGLSLSCQPGGERHVFSSFVMLAVQQCTVHNVHIVHHGALDACHLKFQARSGSLDC